MMFNCPKISCVTLGRANVQKALRCYLNQTYNNKELIILSQGSVNVNEIRDHGRSDIFPIEVPASLTPGAVRNLAIELTRGEVVCQWDEGDLYHPLRLASQFHALLSRGASASFYMQYLKCQADEVYWIDCGAERAACDRYLPSSIMCWKDLFYQFHNFFYPECGEQGREEFCLLQKVVNSCKIAALDDGHHYLHTSNNNNESTKRVLGKDDLLKRKDLLLEAFRLTGVDRAVRVRSLQETVFEYTPSTNFASEG